MTLLCTVMAWGTENEVEVDNFTDLKTQLSVSGTAAVVKLKNDIAYPTNGSDILNIGRSLTLDGQGHMIKGYGKTNTHVSGSGQNHNSVIAVNANVFGAAPTLNVTIKNLKLGNVKDEYTTDGQQKAAVDARFYGIISFDGVAKLTLENDSLKTGVIYDSKKKKWVGPGNQQPLCFTGTHTTPLQLTINDSYIDAGNGAYPAYVLKPITATFNNTTTEGWCALYLKYRYSLAGTAYTTYGDVAGTRGSVVTANNCAFNAPNIHEGQTNGFAVFVFEDDGITLNLNNCSMNAERFTSQAQMVFSLQYGSRAVNDENKAPVVVNISGDNTHLYNVEEQRFALSGWNTNDDDYPSTYTPMYKDAPLHMNITGGTFTINPENIKFRNYNNEGTEVIWEYANIPSTHKVETVNQGGKTLYRVVKKPAEKEPGVLYDLNDNVQSQGDGQNPNTSFELSNGTTMTLDQPTTKAGYVEVSAGTTVTVANNQTLVINNGLDVQGTSVVTAKPGSALVIGEGGIVTAKPENIVVEADNNGAASLLLDPTITVNQTPELTVKMVAKNVGKIGTDYFWHRFALPVDEVHIDADPAKSTWKKDGHSYGTLLYKWDYTNNKWVSLSDVNEMQPFYGYTMTLEEEVADPSQLKEAGYIFKGKLMGNVPSVLNFSRQGYNYFGNSYTGYISIVKLVDELIGNDNLDGTVWMWDPTTQKYEGIPLNDLKNNSNAARYTGANSWKAEVAPMQTFILRLMTEDTDTKANIDYATAVWGNPRYEDVTGASHAPARRAENNNETYVRVIVSAANGKADAVNFQEGVNFSDANDRGYDAAKYMNERTVNVYATVNGENYGTVATDNIEGQSLTINTIDEIAYTISFADVEGRELALRDNVTGQVINIEEGATYEFAAQPNSTVEGRFEIINRAQMPTAIENTEVNANAKGIYTIMGQYMGEDFSILPAGVYVVNGVKIVK